MNLAIKGYRKLKDLKSLERLPHIFKAYYLLSMWILSGYIVVDLKSIRSLYKSLKKAVTTEG